MTQPIERQGMHQNRPAAFEFDGFILDTADERLFDQAGPISLGRRAYGVLLTLLDHQGLLVTKESLFESVWQDTIVSDSALTSVIKEIRRALGDERGRHGLIETVYGRGYRFAGTVREAAAAERRTENENSRKGNQPYLITGQAPLLFVPPFADSVADQEPSVAAMLREEVLFAFARFRDIRLVSEEPALPKTHNSRDRTRSRAYRLDVTFIGAAPAIQLSLRITRLGDGTIIWSDMIKIASTEVHSLIGVMVNRIITDVLPQIDNDLMVRAPAEAFDLFDRYFLTVQKYRIPQNVDDVESAIAAWTEMIDNYPEFALAYSKLIRLLNTDGGYVALGMTGPKERTKARKLARAALSLDPVNAHFHVLLGWSHLWSREGKKAQRHLAEAAALNPFNAVRLLEVATGFMFIGDLDRAEEILDNSAALTPFATDALLEDQGLLCFLRGDYDAAEDRLSLIEQPTISASLYRCLAAEAAGAASADTLVTDLVNRISQLWYGQEPPDQQQILNWTMLHHPFQDNQAQKKISGLVSAALARCT